MCVSFKIDDFERELMRQKLTRTMLDQWLADQTEGEGYNNQYKFFHQFGLHLGIDRRVTVTTIAHVSPYFYHNINAYVAEPSRRVFGAARERLLEPKSAAIRSRLSLIPA